MKKLRFKTLKPFLLQLGAWSSFAIMVIVAHSTLFPTRTVVADIYIYVRIAGCAVLYNLHQIMYRHYFSTRRYRTYSVIMICALVISGIGLQAFRAWWEGNPTQLWHIAGIVRGIFDIALFFTIVMSAILFVRHMSNQYALQEARHEIRALQAGAELKMLQAQINPHFLFNTLHSLYTLIALDSKQSRQKAQEVVLILADLMRYMYQTANAKTVKLSEEVENIERFIALHRLRLGKRAEFCFDVSGALETWDIPPLILLTFVENAIKHGVETTSKGAYLEASLTIGTSLHFYSVNSKSLLLASGSTFAPQKDSSTGLANVRRRLELMYPQRFDLSINETEQAFTVDLWLWNSERGGV